MGHWGIKSYENDAASDALDAGFDRVHGERYEELMDDRNPLTYEQVQQQLADARTLTTSIDALWEAVGRDLAPEDWDDEARLGMAGVVVRHAELKVPIPEEWRGRAIDWLDGEEIEWESATTRKLRRQKEIDLLRNAPSAAAEAGQDRGDPPA
jgi:hypothetical protein